MDPFTYEPLRLDEPSFRLVRLIAGRNSAIRCHLIHASKYDAEDAIEYEALSYTWGSNTTPKLIEIDGRGFKVTQNLLEALTFLRHTDEDRILWIDAICIDQSNTKERGHQVQQMPAIYERASQVIIWLGAGDCETDLLFSYMAELESQTLNYPCSDWEPSDRRWQFIWSGIRLPQSKLFETIDDSLERNIMLHDFRSGMRHLLARPWFRRIWIVQEVAKARRAKVMCGTKSVSARIFAVVPSVIDAKVSEHQQVILDIMPGPSRKHSWWSRNRALHILLEKFKGSSATDPRDRVYALLGISSDAHDTAALRPDYTRTLEELSQTTLAFLLKLDVLGVHSGCLPTFTLDMIHSQPSKLLEDIVYCAISEQSNGRLRLRSKFGINDITYLNKPRKDTPPRKRQRRIVFTSRLSEWTALLDPNLINISYLDSLAQEGRIRTPIFWAIYHGRTDMLQALLASGNIDFDSPDPILQTTPLCLAVKLRHKDIVQSLLSVAKVDINTLEPKSGETALHMAIKTGHEGIASLLLSSPDATLDSSTPAGFSILLLALSENFVSLVETLRANSRANMSARDSNVPLMFASGYYSTVIRSMHRTEHPFTDTTSTAGDQHHSETGEGKDLSMVEAMFGPDHGMSANDSILSSLQKLFDSGQVDVNTRDDEGQSLIDIAARLGDTAVIGMLLRIEALEVNATNAGGQSALAIAAENGHASTVSALLQHKNIQVDRKNHTGMTPLMLAAAGGYTAIVESLLQTGDVNIDQANLLGDTSLVYAIGGGHKQVADLLLSYGASPCFRNTKI